MSIFPSFTRRGLLGLALALVAVLALPLPASAQSLDEARAQGLVAETATGYLEARSSDPAIRQLVQSVNQQRESHYRAVAERNDVPVSAVERQAGQELVAQYPPR